MRDLITNKWTVVFVAFFIAIFSAVLGHYAFEMDEVQTALYRRSCSIFGLLISVIFMAKTGEEK